MKYVTQGPWGVSFGTGYGLPNGQVRLSVYRMRDIENGLGGRGETVHGDAHGKIFPNIEAAERFAFEHGYLKEYLKGWCPQCRAEVKSQYPTLDRNGEEVGYGRAGWCPTHQVFTI